MSEDFVLSGDPGSISASGRTWGEFSTSASTASISVRGVQAGAVQGDEWTHFTDAINDSLPGHLDTTSDAWGIVSSALIIYADKLTGFQQRMSSLKSTYDSQQTTAANAKANLDAAHRGDQAEKTRVSSATGKLKPGETLPPSTYVSSTSGAQSSFTEANSNLQGTVNAAAQVRKEHSEALQSAVSDVNRAKGMRFQKPPGWFSSMMHSVGGWIKDHADILKKISGVLKIISAVAGVLSLIPGLNVIMARIALITGGLALGIDIAVKLATGEGSWLGVGIDAATMLLPGVGKLAGKGLKGAVDAERFAATTSKVKNAVNGSKAVTGLKASRGFKGLIKANDTVYAAVNKVPGLRGLNERAAAKAIERVRANGTPVDTAQAIANRHPNIVERTRANDPIVKRPAPRGPTKQAAAALNKRTSTGEYICPESGRVSPTQQNGLPVTDPRHPDAMSIGHKDGSDYSASQVIHTYDGSTRQQVLDDYNNPVHYHGYENAKHNSSKASDSHLDNYTNNRLPVWDTTSPWHGGGGLIRLGNDS